MSALKLEIQKIAVDNLVDSLEKTQDASEVASIELRGSVVGANACLEVISRIMASVKDQFDAGKLDIEQTQLVRRYLNTCVGGCATIIRNAKTASTEKYGLSEGLKPLITRMHASSEKLQKSIEEEAASPSPEREAPTSMKSRRLSEDEVEGILAKVKAKEEPEDSEVTEITDDMISELAQDEGIPDLAKQISAMVESEQQNGQDTR